MSVEIRVPTLGESIVDARVAAWLKREGDTVQRDEALVELETDKVNVEVAAQQDGLLQRVVKQVGDVVAVGEVLGIISVHANRESSAVQRPPSPLARRIAAEHDIDLSQVKGISPHGRITKDDVIDYLERNAQKGSTQPPPSTAPSSQPAQTQQPARNGAVTIPAAFPSTPQPPVTPKGREERVHMSRRRQIIAQRLVEAQHTAAMLTTFNEIDMTAVMDIRSRRKDWFKEHHDVSLGYMSFFTKAVVGTLKIFPRLNAEIQDNDMVLKYYYDIGIAVGAQEGLVVPVLRDADRKSFAQIEREIADLAKRVREGKLTLPELQGGTFTISNGGVYGSLLSTPILNVPQVGIVGMHKIEQRPIALNGQVVIRPMMYIALSYDHRIVDGSEAVRFLVKVKELIEDPEMLLLEG
ncbi:MAG: 2-oxoglutarate dehydrogenase complex dihydrolipoyllysine-residue succinyltransferase [Ktedonobacteraceae bacterium]|nr:2-oxoglutarate dehydrogenase complex dihydrolipoyllysine-residue succinyltransferase [Ktedonobacteraceae bacterium]